MTRRSPRRLLELLKSVYMWHRQLGLFAAILVLHLALTGMALNHDEALGLSEKSFSASWLPSRYGGAMPESGLELHRRWISASPDGLWLDERLLLTPGGRLVGSAQWQDGWAVALTDAVLLLDAEGRLVERLGPAALPGTLDGLAAGDGGYLLQSGGAVYWTDSEFLRWQDSAAARTAAAPLRPLPTQLRDRMQPVPARVGLDRLLLDLHTGEFFGPAGRWLMDAAAIAFILLAISGIWLWIRYRRTQRLKHRWAQVRRRMAAEAAHPAKEQTPPGPGGTPRA